ncbi:MAG TPA: efflux transporter outer membrane subunit [Vicinamibacterales bacterium]|nr:efflux transporter outer membrane subunit [Vicinamibacterales bacterium]
MKRCVLIVVVSVSTASCTLGPNYRRPTVGMPSAYRDTTAAVAQPGPGSLADVQWFDLFKDDTLGRLVRTALAQNFDLQIAAERVLQARERFHIVRADQFPLVVGSAGASQNRVSEIGARPLPPGFGPDISDVQAGFGIAWELDVWGRLRRSSEAARAQYLATEEARRGVVITLIADVTDAYFALQTLDRQLAIAGGTRDVAVNGLRLTELRRDRGVATRLDVRQAEQLLYTATAQIASVQRDIAQTEDALSLLLGQAPGDIARSGEAVQTLDAAPLVPPGLPSSLLERRPDIRQAEQMLVAANAQIGVARADYFPRIGLTGVLGVESRDLTELLTAPARTWSVGAAAAAPIFNAGRTRANVRLSESLERELVVSYRRTIYLALREVSDALAGYHKTGEQRAQQEQLVAALRDAAQLSTDRYQGGLDSYLQVLDAQRGLFRSELDLAALQRQELAAIVELYRALGGGWTGQP